MIEEIINEMSDIETYFLEKYNVNLSENLLGLAFAAKGAGATFGGHRGYYPHDTAETPKKTKEEKAAEKRAEATRKILQRKDYAERRKRIRDENERKRIEKFRNSVEYKVGIQYR